MESPSGADVVAEGAEDETAARGMGLWIGLRQARAGFASCSCIISDERVGLRHTFGAMVVQTGK